MTDQCAVGPISVEAAQLLENNDHAVSGAESFDILCTHTEALQIMGLATPSTIMEYPGMKMVTGKEGTWGHIWIDGSTSLEDNLTMQHRGWFVILDVRVEQYFSADWVQLNLLVERISNYESDIMNVLYSRGGEDGTTIPHDYEDTSTVYLLNEGFDTPYTDNWKTYTSSGMTGITVTTSGSKLAFTGTNSTSNKWGGINVGSKYTFTPDWTCEFDLEWVSGTSHNLNVFILPTNATYTWSQLRTPTSTSNWVRIYLYSSGSKLYYAVSRCIAGKNSYLVNPVELNTTSEKAPRFKVKYYKTGAIEIWIDKSGGTSWTKIWGKASLGLKWTAPSFYYQFNNASNSAKTMKTSGFQVYTDGDTIYPNVVHAPAGCSPAVTPDFYRASEDGNIPCWTDPNDDLPFAVDKDDFYDGMVKLYTTYPDDVSKLVTGGHLNLAPDEVILRNGLTRLTVTDDSVLFGYWNGAAYVDLNEFVFPSAIKMVKAEYVDPATVKLRIDRTWWTMKQGKPYVYVKHPETAFDYIRRTCYYHDPGTTTDPAADANIAMETQYYCNIWNRGTGSCATPSPADNYRLQILQKYSTTIKSDSIPAAALTGIGWYDATETSTDPNGYLSLAQEFWNDTWQSIAIRGV